MSGERDSTILRAALAAEVARADDGVPTDEATARVLVADDDPGTRSLLAAILRAHGYSVETACDGAEAVERAGRGDLDVVLLEAIMPAMSGVAACRAIRAARGEGFLPVALVFARTDVKSRVEALEIGVDGYVCKPFEETELLLCISAALRAKRAHDAMCSAQSRLERLRAYDDLTSARSFRFLHDRLAAEFARAEAHAEPLACCLLDVDRLKVQNEIGGRARGDAVLQGVVEVVRSSVRDSDVVARYGGDELFVMLPATHFAGALVVASRIWRDVGARTFGPPAYPDARVTVSVGVALYPSRDVRTRQALLHALEAALHEAKRRGGDRLCVFQQDGLVFTPST